MRVQKTCEGLQMITAEAQSMVRGLVGPYRDRKRRLEAVARLLGWQYSRVFNVFYGRHKRLDAHEWVKLNEEFTALRESARERAGLLHELEILDRKATEARHKNARSMGVENGASVEAPSGRQHRG